MNRSKLITSIVLRFIAIFLFIISFFDKYVGTIFYFTVQSNLLVILVFLVLNIFDILKLCGKFISTPKNLYRFKYISVVGITLTFLVFGLVLTPVILFETNYPFYILSISSLSMHLIIPIISIVDWFINDYIENPKVISFLLPLAFPLYYFFFAMIGSVAGLKYQDFFSTDVGGNHVPYFFLDYKKYGWIDIQSNEGVLEFGVLYWVIGITILVTIISFLYLLPKLLPAKSKK